MNSEKPDPIMKRFEKMNRCYWGVEQFFVIVTVLGVVLGTIFLWMHSFPPLSGVTVAMFSLKIFGILIATLVTWFFLDYATLWLVARLFGFRLVKYAPSWEVEWMGKTEPREE